jgi:hypothetical protein
MVNSQEMVALYAERVKRGEDIWTGESLDDEPKEVKLTKWHCIKCHDKFDRSVVGKRRLLFLRTKLCEKCINEI